MQLTYVIIINAQSLEIEIIDESELREINELEASANQEANNGSESDDEDMQEDYATDNEPPEENAKLVFTRHKEAALCVCLSKKGDIALSGGQDDVAYLWNTENGNILVECVGHKDSIVCVAFSQSEKYIATGDMSGLIQVWKVENGEKIYEYEVEELQWLKWHTVLDTVLLCGTESGASWLLKVNDPSQIKTFQGPAVACGCGKISVCGSKAVMGYNDGSVKLIDLKTGNALINIRGTYCGIL